MKIGSAALAERLSQRTTAALFASALLILIVAEVYSIGFGVRFDGYTFFVTGERVLKGNFREIYSPTGAGPFTYLAPTALFFALLPIFGQGALVLAAAAALFGAIVLLAAFARVFSSVASTLLVLIAAGSFWFIAWESLFLGQIDTVFLLFIALGVVCESLTSYGCGAAAIAWVSLFKPQLCLTFLPYVLRKRFRAFLSAGILLATVIVGYCSFVRWEWGQVAADFLTYRDRASVIALSTNDVTNQSCRAVAMRLLTEKSFDGRYYPEWFSAAPLRVGIAALDPYSVGWICLIIQSICGLLLAVFFYKHRDRIDTFQCTAVVLAALPTLSPLFWFVHGTYLILPSIYVAASLRCAHLWQKLLFGGVIIVLYLGSPLIIGNEMADLIAAYGSVYWISIVLLLLSISIRRSSAFVSR